MKLIYCPRCDDVISLRVKQSRTCWCGASGGQYVDNLNAEISGEAIVLGFDSRAFLDAVETQPEKGWGKDFKAFVIAKKCPTVNYVSEPAV